LSAILAPGLTRVEVHHEPNEQFGVITNEFGIPKGPNAQFWLGADGTPGRDLFFRILQGARTSLTDVLLATGLSELIGVLLGGPATLSSCSRSSCPTWPRQSS